MWHNLACSMKGRGAWPIFGTRSCHRFQADLKCKTLLCQPDKGITKRSHEDAWLPSFWNNRLLLSLDIKLTYHGESHNANACWHLPLRTNHTAKLRSGHRASSCPTDLPFKGSYPKLYNTQHLPSIPRALLWGRFLQRRMHEAGLPHSEKKQVSPFSEMNDVTVKSQV